MKKFFLLLFILFPAKWMIAQSEPIDSIGKSVALDEVTVIAPNMTRMKDYLLITPTEQQRKQASNGYEFLKKLMIPGLTIDTQSNAVETMGMPVSLYINGQECESKDVQLIRPKDIEKIEYHDIPTGKYAKDLVAINFILKQYKYGGYIQMDGLQTIGYTHGTYNIASSISHGNTTFSVFGGANYENVSGNETYGDEYYYFSERSVHRVTDASNTNRNHNEYVQFRIQNQKGKRYFVGKVSLINNVIPQLVTKGGLKENECKSLYFRTNSKQKSIVPKVDFNGTIPLSEKENLIVGVHGTYSRNTYKRNYIEAEFNSMTDEMENAGHFQLSALYENYGENQSFSIELYHYHNIWDAQYSGSYDLWQHLWQCESLAFFTYSTRFTKKLSLNARIGADWLQYRLHGNDKFSQLSPRLNVNLQYRLPVGTLLGSFNYVNSSYDMNVINRATININPYMMEKGNPELKKSHDINSYIYYSAQLRKLNLTGISQYKFNHNPVMQDYYIENDQLVRTYMNSGNMHYFSIIGAITYSVDKNLSFSGDIRYNHTQVSSTRHLHNNDFTGNLNANLYAGDFSISPYVKFNKKILDQTSLAIKKIPISYGIICSYSCKNLFASMEIESPFTKRKTQNLQTTPYYIYDITQRDRLSDNYCNIKIAYTFDFGRKTNKIKRDIDNNINSSLLRVEL